MQIILAFAFRLTSCILNKIDVIVDDVTPMIDGGAEVRGGAENEIAIDLDVHYIETSETTSVTGQGLWTTRLWMSPTEDGSVELAGTVVEEALTEGQQAQDLKKNPSGRHVIRDIRYRFDLTDYTCDDAKYVCAKFNKGPNPEPAKSFLPFNFSATPDEAVLTGCSEVQRCQGKTFQFWSVKRLKNIS